MKHVCIRRHPSVYLVGLLELLIVHFVLCYPAATCRGWPPLETFWQVSIYLAFLGIALLPVFDDFAYAPKARRIFLVAFGVESSIILGAAMVNLGSPTPHFGNSARYPGLLWYGWPSIARKYPMFADRSDVRLLLGVGLPGNLGPVPTFRSSSPCGVTRR
jgi:hypothetical protein